MPSIKSSLTLVIKMIFTSIIKAGDLNCTTGLNDDNKTYPLTDRYFAHPNFTEGTKSILGMLKTAKPDMYSSATDTFEFDLNWVFPHGDTQDYFNDIVNYVNQLFKKDNFPVSFKSNATSLRFSNLIVYANNDTTHEEVYNKWGVKSRTTINLFLAESIPDASGTIGWASIPGFFDKWDGIFMDGSRSYTPKDHMETIAHEFGHFLGLYHTFQGGCSGDGDYVTDTVPADDKVRQGESFGWKCDSKQNTCGITGKYDMVENIMDYTNCGTTFTDEQKFRMMNYVYHRATGDFPKIQ